MKTEFNHAKPTKASVFKELKANFNWVSAKYVARGQNYFSSEKTHRDSDNKIIKGFETKVSLSPLDSSNVKSEKIKKCFYDITSKLIDMGGEVVVDNHSVKIVRFTQKSGKTFTVILERMELCNDYNYDEDSYKTVYIDCRIN